MGRVGFAFVEPNEYGVLDHDVTLPSGDIVHNPMGVIPDGNGSEVVFTLRRLTTMTDGCRDRRRRNPARQERDVLERRAKGERGRRDRNASTQFIRILRVRYQANCPRHFAQVVVQLVIASGQPVYLGLRDRVGVEVGM
jgi:hypothetical protein